MLQAHESVSGAFSSYCILLLQQIVAPSRLVHNLAITDRQFCIASIQREKAECQGSQRLWGQLTSGDCSDRDAGKPPVNKALKYSSSHPSSPHPSNFLSVSAARPSIWNLDQSYNVMLIGHCNRLWQAKPSEGGAIFSDSPAPQPAGTLAATSGGAERSEGNGAGVAANLMKYSP